MTVPSRYTGSPKTLDDQFLYDVIEGDKYSKRGE